MQYSTTTEDRAHLQDVDDAEVQHDVLRLLRLPVRAVPCRQRGRDHVAAQLHAPLPHAVADLVRRARAEGHRPVCGASNSLIVSSLLDCSLTAGKM